ncbi:MAG: hypothetical protein ACPGJS_20445 [Flammeovirgaceae bacterium]
MGRKYRYPGSKPFEEAEKDLFFGREDDIDRLTESIKVEPLLVLYGKSGLGKSSLLNAGVVPKLQATGEYDVCMVRLGSYQKDAEEQYTPPINKLLRAVRMNRRKESFLRKIHRDSHSLWQSYKGIQIAEESEKEFVLIIDQFEELFTYPDRDVRIFKQQLAEALSGAVPQRFRNALKNKMAENPEILSRHEMNLLYKSMPLHIVFAIRSDKLSLLNRLNNHIPTILQCVYELKPLTREQAEDAILNPADLPDESNMYASPAFDYEDESLDKILDFLTRRNDKEIESFQLQILCQYVEENIVISNKDLSISPDDLGDLEDIYLNYYDHQINKLELKENRDKARRLIEEGLIFDEEKRRVSMYEGQILRKYEISKELLADLVDTHLLRPQPNPSGGFSYEISHDTLVGPILKSKTKRLEQEYEKKREEEIEKKSKKQLIKVVVILLIIGAFVSGGIGVGWFLSLVESEKELQAQKKELQNTNIKLQQALDINEQYSKTTIGALLEEKKDLLQLYNTLLKENQKLVDSVATAMNSAGTNDADLEQEILRLEARNKRLLSEIKRLANQIKRERAIAASDLKDLIKELEQAAWNIVVKQSEFNKLKTGVIKSFKDKHKELENKARQPVKVNER